MSDSSARAFVGFALFGLVALLVFVAVLFGVMNPASEPGFFEGAPTWGKLPVSVSVGRYSAEGTRYKRDDHKMVSRVVSRINSQLGVTVFRMIDVSGSVDAANAANAADVAIELGLPWDVDSSGEGGRAEIRQSRALAVGCDVVVSSVVPWAIEPLVVHHELGHCLGLDDDDNDYSIMYPRQTKSSHHEFTSHDADLLRARYVRPVDAGGE